MLTSDYIPSRDYVLADNYIYISHLDQGLKFWHLPCYPDQVTDQMGSTFTPTTALGRTAPIYTYSGSGPRTVNINIPLRREIMDDVNYGVSNATLQDSEDYVDNLINALRSIALPRLNLKNKSLEPPIVAIRINNEVFIKGVVTSDIGLDFAKPILKNGKYAQVSLSLSISEIDPYDSQQVYKQGGFRGVVQTLKSGMNIK